MEGVISNGDELAATRQSGRGREQRRCDVWHLAALVSDSDGNSVSVKIIHERDQFLQNIPPQEFPLTHSVRDPYGDFWSSTVPIAGIAPPTQDSAWGTAGRYLYRGYITLGETLWKFIREATHRDRSPEYFRLDRPIVPIL